MSMPARVSWRHGSRWAAVVATTLLVPSLAPAAPRQPGTAAPLRLAIDDCPPASPRATDRKERAARLYDRGRRRYLRGDYQGATREFIAAYCASPHHMMLENIAQAFERQVDYETALAYFERCLAAIPASDRSRRTRIGHRIRVLRGLPARVTVATEPRGAAIELVPLGRGGGAPITARDRQLLTVRGGRYELRISRPGHRPVHQPITLHIGRPYSFYFRLLPDTGTLRVRTTPRGARVFVDQRLVGTTPYEGALAAGRHQVVVEAAGHLAAHRSIELAGHRDQLLELNLAPLPERGRWELITAYTVAGMVVGGVAFGLSGDDHPVALGVGIGGGTALLASAYWVPRSTSLSTANLITGAMIVSLLDGRLTAETLGAGDDTAVSIGLATLGLGTAAATVLAPRLSISPGDVSLINSGILWGTWSASIADSAVGADDSPWFGLVGVNGGLAGAVWLSRHVEMSRRRVLLIDLSGALGTLAGAGLLQLGDSTVEDQPERYWFVLGGTWAGLLAGAWFTRNVDDVGSDPERWTPRTAVVEDRAGHRVPTFGLQGSF